MAWKEGGDSGKVKAVIPSDHVARSGRQGVACHPERMRGISHLSLFRFKNEILRPRDRPQDDRSRKSRLMRTDVVKLTFPAPALQYFSGTLCPPEVDRPGRAPYYQLGRNARLFSLLRRYRLRCCLHPSAEQAMKGAANRNVFFRSSCPPSPFVPSIVPLSLCPCVYNHSGPGRSMACEAVRRR